MAKTLITVFVKEVLLVLVLVTGFVRLPSPLSVLLVLSDSALTAAFLIYIRVSARLLMKENKDVKTQAGSRNALVAGTDESSLRLAAQLEKEGYSVAGLLTRDSQLAGRVISDYVVYLCEDPSQLSRLQWQLGGIDCVFFPKGQADNVFGGASEETDKPQQDGMSLAGHLFKRSFDVLLSASLLLLFSPVIGVCALLIKREDGGPVIFAQERIGRGGMPFKIYKFRSMKVDAEGELPALYSGEDDPRLTRTGRFLRAHHLDELPQLWNVLKGDMSFIGYRPERQYYIDQIMACNARYRYLYQIRPGVTSYATLYNGYTDTLEKMLTRLDLDLYYLRNHSVWFDAKVLGLTFLSIVSGKKF